MDGLGGRIPPSLYWMTGLPRHAILLAAEHISGKQTSKEAKE